jgi:hypothetical protein
MLLTNEEVWDACEVLEMSFLRIDVWGSERARVLEDGALIQFTPWSCPPLRVTALIFKDGTRVRGEDDGPWWDWVRDIVRRKKAEKEKAKLEAEAKRKEDLDRLAARFVVIPSGSAIRYFDEVTPIPPAPKPSYPKFKIGDEVVGQAFLGPLKFKGGIRGKIDRIDLLGEGGSHYRVNVSSGPHRGSSVCLLDEGLRKAGPEPVVPPHLIPAPYENMSQWDKLMSFLHLRKEA